ncbi:MAG: sulfurtransferase-like selenium metabolism protein YedF [Clostridia bacterium]|nr:sulfurtransferase-like selenium metabolism protein YedF [Clostridia bacterium]
MKTIVVNAMGDACPIPVVKATKALNEIKEAGVVEVHVDNEIAVQNLNRLAGSKGLKAASEKRSDKEFVVKMALEGPVSVESAAVCIPDARGDEVVAIGSNCMGEGDDALGATLMKGFIYALSQQPGKLPKAIVFYNGGAKITVEGSVSIEDLKSMEAQGVEILTCGTCLNFYGLSDKLAVGSVSNMYTIVETLNAASKVIRP